MIQLAGNPIKTLPIEIVVSTSDSCADLYSKISRSTNCSEHRFRITKGSDGSFLPNQKDTAIERTGLKDQSWISVKDQGLFSLLHVLMSFCAVVTFLDYTGPQISWLLVFIIEYLGPLLIHPLIYYFRSSIYRNPKSDDAEFPGPSYVQQLSFALIIIHFLKRELETLFVHRFSLATMPLPNIFRNCAHYWILSGFLIAYTTYGPRAKAAGPTNGWLAYPGLLLFAIGELANFSAHIILRNLRSSNGTERGIPKGLGFDMVTCPNYLYEVISWIGIWMVNRSVSTGIFLAVAGAIMAIWAKQKERKYRKEFGDKYKRKPSVMLPGII